MKQVSLFGEEVVEEKKGRYFELKGKYEKKFNKTFLTEKEFLIFLTELVNKYCHIYYVLDNKNENAIEDDEFDILYDDLVLLEKELKTILSNSPTQRVGTTVLDKLEKHTHLGKLYSSDKFKHGEFEGLKKFINNAKKINPNVEFVVEYKFDGLTVALTYENGVLQSGATRGNGSIGENITQNIRVIKSIPLSIPIKDIKIEIAGEGIMPLDKFKKYNEQADEKGYKKLANARNGASGSIRQLDSSETAKRPLDAYFYNVSYSEGIEFKTHTESLKYLKSLGFRVADYWLVDSFDKILSLIDFMQEERLKLNFEIDGLVIKVNDIETREKLGYTNKFPKWMIAYKFPPKEKATKIIDVLHQVGKTGKITPKAIVESIDLGVNVTNATLHNYEEVNRMDVKIGDTVKIKRSGDVIPYIVEVLTEKRTGNEKEIVPPKECPSCKEKLHKLQMADGKKEKADIYCINPSCPAQLKRRIEYFCSRDCMDINIGTKTSDILVDNYLVSNIADLYTLKEKDLYILEGFKEKKIGNILSSINKSKEKPFLNVLTALNVNLVGKSTAEKILDVFSSIEGLKLATRDEIISIPDVGEGVANSLEDFFENQKSMDILNKLIDMGLNFEHEKQEIKESSITDKTFVVTGTLSKSRDLFKNEIKELGGKITNSISKNTNYLLVGDKAGSKLKKAQEINDKAGEQIITILRESDYYNLINK